MADPLRHRQTKGAATDMVDLRPPRHIPTLPTPAVPCSPAIGGNRRSAAGAAGAEEWRGIAPLPTLVRDPAWPKPEGIHEGSQSILFLDPDEVVTIARCLRHCWMIDG